VDGADISTPPVAQAEPSTGAQDSVAGGARGAATVFSDLTSVSGARLGSAVLSALTVVITTRLLKPSGYALIAYVTVVASLMFTATSAWTAASVTRYGREELERRGSMTATSWNRLLISAPLVLTAGCVVLACKLLGGLPREMTWLFVWLAIASGLLTIGSEHIVSLLEASGRMKLTAVVLTLRQAVTVAGLAVIFVTGHGRTPATVIALNVLALGGVVVLLAVALWRVALWPATIDRALLRRMLAFSIPLIAFSASQYVIQSVDIVVLRAYTSPSSVGIYAVAYQGYSVLQQIATSATIVLTPLFVSLGAANKHRLLERYVTRSVPQLAFVSAALTSLAIPLLGIAAQIVFGHGFRSAGRPMAILFGALALYACASFIAPLLMLGERSRAIAAVNVVAAVLNAVGDIVFVGFLHMGVLGPALATTLALGFIAVGYLRSAAGVRLAGWLRPGPGLVLLSPLAAATLPALLLSGAAGVGVGLVAAVVSVAAILRWMSPFDMEDADMIAKLDMPPVLKQLALRSLRGATR
jgi:O-antigen/teichoic acid export membrane protein